MLGRLVSYSMKRRVWVRRDDEKCEKRRNMSDSNFRPNSECSWRKKKPLSKDSKHESVVLKVYDSI